MADPIAFEVEWGAVYLAISAVRVETPHRGSYRRDNAVYMADSHQVQMAAIWHSLSCRWGVCCPVYIVECQRTLPQQGKGGEVWARWHLPHTSSNSHGTSEYQGSLKQKSETV